MTSSPSDPFATPSSDATPNSAPPAGFTQQPVHTTGAQAENPGSVPAPPAPPVAPAAPGYPQYMMSGQQEHPQGTLILVLGILGFFVGLSGPVAWVMGNKALKEIDAAPGVFSNRGNVVAGRICGIIVTIFMIVMLVLMILGIIAILVFAKDMPTTGTTY